MLCQLTIEGKDLALLLHLILLGVDYRSSNGMLARISRTDVCNPVQLAHIETMGAREKRDGCHCCGAEEAVF